MHELWSQRELGSNPALPLGASPTSFIFLNIRLFIGKMELTIHSQLKWNNSKWNEIILNEIIFLKMSVIYNIQDMTKASVSIDGWMDQENVVGLPWWRSGWESACQCRAHGFEPWSGRIPHAAERLGPWATIAEPARLEPVLHNGRGRDGEGPAHRDEEWPPLAAAGESPRTEMKTQHSQK